MNKPTTAQQPQCIPLKTAVFYFCDSRLIDRYRAAEKAYHEQFNAHHEEMMRRPNNVKFDQLITSLNLFSRSFRPAKKEMEELRSNLLLKIKNADVFVHGYIFPRGINDSPVEIPRDFWNQKINWENCEIEGQGLKFVGVTISQSFSKNVPEIKKAGRPSLKKDIYEAYEQLNSKKLFPQEMPINNYYPIVRDYLSSKYPDRKGYYKDISNEVIRKYLSPIIKKDK